MKKEKNDLLKSTLNILSSAVQIPGFAINSNGKLLFNDDVFELPFCSTINRKNTRCKYCQRTFAQGVSRASMFGGQYITFCPAGMCFLTIAFETEQKLEAGIVMGPVALGMPTESDLKQELQDTEYSVMFAQQIIKKIPLITIEQLISVAQVSSFLPIYKSRKEGFEHYLNNMDLFINKFKHLLMNNIINTSFLNYQEEFFIKAIEDRNEDKVKDIYKNIICHLYYTSNYNIEIIKLRFAELIASLVMVIKRLNIAPEQAFLFKFDILNLIIEVNSFEDLNKLSEKIFFLIYNLTFHKKYKHSDIIYNATCYVWDNYTKKILLEDMCQKLFIHPTYFSKIFKSEMGISFAQYIVNYRIEVSKNLLSKDIPISQVAKQVGFKSVSYYIKTFRELTGCTPNEFRKG